MGFRNWVTKNATKVVETTVEQSKQAIGARMENRTDLYFKLARLGLLAVLMWLTGKEAGGYLREESAPKGLPSPTSIVINNYIREDKERSNE